MRGGYIFSASLHAGIIALVVFGLPRWVEPPQPEQYVPVELVTLDEIEKESPPEPEPDPEPKAEEPEPDVKPEQEIEPGPQTATLPTPPEVARREEPEPKTEPEPEPEQEALRKPEPEREPEPVPELEPRKKPEAKPDPPPEPRRKPETKIAQVEKPKKEAPKKEEPPQADVLSSILKNVEKLKDQPKQEQVATAEVQAEKPQTSAIEQRELERLIRSQLEACWRLEPGAREAEDLVVKVRVQLNQDGSVRQARVEDVDRMIGDAYYRSAAENALRAIHKCSPFSGLPLNRYAAWRDLTLNFNPSEMF